MEGEAVQQRMVTRDEDYDGMWADDAMCAEGGKRVTTFAASLSFLSLRMLLSLSPPVCLPPNDSRDGDHVSRRKARQQLIPSASALCRVQHFRCTNCNVS